MGVIISMNSETFQKKFLKDVTDTSRYQFILISEDVKQRMLKDNKKGSNIMTMKTLIPSPPVITLHANGEIKAYKQAYLNQLQDLQCDSAISVLVKAAVQDDLNLILICSTSEEDRGDYLSLLREYIEVEYGLKTYTWKKYIKDTEKAETIKNKNDVIKVLGRKFEKLRKNGVSLSSEVDSEERKKALSKFGKKDLRKIASAKNVKWDKDMDKDQLIKKIMKKMTA